MLIASGMTFHAILVIGNALFQITSCSFLIIGGLRVRLDETADLHNTLKIISYRKVTGKDQSLMNQLLVFYLRIVKSLEEPPELRPFWSFISEIFQ